MFQKSVVESVGKCVGEPYFANKNLQGSLGSPPKKLRIEIVMGVQMLAKTKENSSKTSCGWDFLSKKEGLDPIYKWKLSPVLNAG